MRTDEFEESDPLMMTSFIAQANVMKRSFKYQKIEINYGEEKYEIKPMFKTQDPNEILRICCFFFFRRINAVNFLALQDNRKEYLIKEAIYLLIEPSMNCDLDEF